MLFRNELERLYSDITCYHENNGVYTILTLSLKLFRKTC